MVDAIYDVNTDMMGNPLGFSAPSPTMPARAPASGGQPGILSGFFNGLNRAQILRASADPSKVIFDELAKQKEFQTEEGRKKLDTVRGDTKFTQALNDAIKNDPTVADGIVNAAGGTTGMSPTSLVNSLQNSSNRRLMTGVLGAVADQTRQQDLGFSYLEHVAGAAEKSQSAGASKEDHKKLKDILALSGQRDSRVDFAADPMSALNRFWKDPSGLVKDMFASFSDSLNGLPPEWKNMIIGFVDMAANGLSGLTNPKGDFVRPYIELGKRAGEELAERGAGLTSESNVGPAPQVQAQAQPQRRASLETLQSTVANSEIRTGVDMSGQFKMAHDNSRTEPETQDFTPALRNRGPQMVLAS